MSEDVIFETHESEREEDFSSEETREEFYKNLLSDNSNLSLENKELTAEVKRLNEFILKKQTEFEIKNKKLKEELKNKKSKIKELENLYWEAESKNQKLIKRSQELTKQVTSYDNQVILLKALIEHIEKHYENDIEDLKNVHKIHVNYLEVLITEILGENQAKKFMENTVF